MFDLIYRLVCEDIHGDETIEELEEMLRFLQEEQSPQEFDQILESVEELLPFRSLAEINAEIAELFQLYVR
jgi:Ca2+-binding EF-hand superfamily protein